MPKVVLTVICFIENKKRNKPLHMSEKIPNIAKQTFFMSCYCIPNTKKGENN